jgi:hypothetical protein
LLLLCRSSSLPSCAQRCFRCRDDEPFGHTKLETRHSGLVTTNVQYSDSIAAYKLANQGRMTGMGWVIETPTPMLFAFSSAQFTPYSTEPYRPSPAHRKSKSTLRLPPCRKLAFAPFYSKKLGHEFIENAHRD